MGAEQAGAEEHPGGINEGVFQKVGIFHSPGVRVFVLVVHLVDMLVEKRGVQCSVHPVEVSVLYQQEDWQLEQHFLPKGSYGGCEEKIIGKGSITVNR